MFCQVWWISFNQTVLRKFPLYNKNYTQLFVHFVQMAYLSNPMQIMTIAFWLQSTTVCSNPTLHDLRIILKWCNIVFLYLHHVNWVANIYDVCMRDGNSDKIVHEWKFHQTLNAIIFKTPRSFQLCCTKLFCMKSSFISKIAIIYSCISWNIVIYTHISIATKPCYHHPYISIIIMLLLSA